MKAYVVIGVDASGREDNYHNWRTRLRNEPEDGGMFVVTPQREVHTDRPFDPDRHVYWVDTDADAQGLAVLLAERFPMKEWRVHVCTSIYKPVIERIARSNFDPRKGLIPA